MVVRAYRVGRGEVMTSNQQITSCQQFTSLEAIWRHALAFAVLAVMALLVVPQAIAGEPGVRSGAGTMMRLRPSDQARQTSDAEIVQRHFATPDAILAWVNNYRLEPDPDKIGLAVKAMARLGMFDEPDRAGVYFGFVGGVIASNQTRARELITTFFPLLPQHQIVVIRALAASGLPEWKELLGHFAERMPARGNLISQYLSGKLKPLAERKFEESPEVLDSYWGIYFATGLHQPVIRIISALPLAADRNNLEKLTVGAMAKWTLATNAQREKDLLDLARAEMNYQPKEVRKELAQVISAAENYETSKLRKDALGAIEQLRAKGPEAARTWVWWGTAVQTVIAIGCVALSVAGVPEAGIPCIIGGAVATGATRMLGPTFGLQQ